MMSYQVGDVVQLHVDRPGLMGAFARVERVGRKWLTLNLRGRPKRIRKDDHRVKVHQRAEEAVQ